jgi:hypothetical protein
MLAFNVCSGQARSVLISVTSLAYPPVRPGGGAPRTATRIWTGSASTHSRWPGTNQPGLPQQAVEAAGLRLAGANRRPAVTVTATTPGGSRGEGYGRWPGEYR